MDSAATTSTGRVCSLESRRASPLVPGEVEVPGELELENVSDAIRGEGALLLRRGHVLGQARALESLHRPPLGAGRPLAPR